MDWPFTESTARLLKEFDCSYGSAARCKATYKIGDIVTLRKWNNGAADLMSGMYSIKSDADEGIDYEEVKREIFVFGSNEAGRHGKGAALYAREHHGAIYGQGEGLQGDSYAIPTKDAKLKPLSLFYIRANVERFWSFAEDNPDLMFNITPVGCGLAGWKRADIKPMFDPPLPNFCFTKEWDE